MKITVGDSTDSLTFELGPWQDCPTDTYRVQWPYRVTDRDGAVLAAGTGLVTPGHMPECRALASLLTFAAAAGEAHYYGSDDLVGFSSAAAEAFHALGYDLALAELELDSGE